MKNWILTHRKIITISAIMFSILLSIFSTLYIKYYNHSNIEMVELLYYTSQFISAIFVISGVVIAVWQYYLSYVESKRNMDIICVQKAIDLSEYYKDNILLYMAPIKYIFENSGINNIIDKIDRENIKHFDKKELNLFIN